MKIPTPWHCGVHFFMFWLRRSFPLRDHRQKQKRSRLTMRSGNEPNWSGALSKWPVTRKSPFSSPATSMTPWRTRIWPVCIRGPSACISTAGTTSLSAISSRATAFGRTTAVRTRTVLSQWWSTKGGLSTIEASWPCCSGKRRNRLPTITSSHGLGVESAGRWASGFQVWWDVWRT